MLVPDLTVDEQDMNSKSVKYLYVFSHGSNELDEAVLIDPSIRLPSGMVCCSLHSTAANFRITVF